MKKKKVAKKYTLNKNILAFLNIFLAILIIITAYKLITIELGKMLIGIGYLIVTISTVLRLAKEW